MLHEKILDKHINENVVFGLMNNFDVSFNEIDKIICEYTLESSIRQLEETIAYGFEKSIIDILRDIDPKMKLHETEKELLKAMRCEIESILTKRLSDSEIINYTIKNGLTQ